MYIRMRIRGYITCSSIMATQSTNAGTGSRSSSDITKPKRKRKVLSIDEKISIIKELETSTGRVVADRYGVATSTISDIKKN